MSLKKILSGLLIGTFVFGVTVGNVSAASDNSAKKPAVQSTDGKNQPPQMKDGKNPPEPPKDSNGNPLPPPDKKDGDNKNSSDGKVSHQQVNKNQQKK